MSHLETPKDRNGRPSSTTPLPPGIPSDDILLGGDFNCVLETADSTGHGSYSPALATLVQSYLLCGALLARPVSNAYTHHTPHGTTTIDCFYLSVDLLGRKTGIATVSTAFSDHFVLVIRLT
jgi:hypothetical protein